MFIDRATIEIRAGKGGDGRSSFRHEKYRAKGGPDGGDGGHGGDVICEVDHNLDTLSHYRTARLIQAEDGQMGGENRKHGKAGAPTTFKVPLGTQIWEGEQLLADLTQPGQSMALARGGRGGFGNAHFTSSTRQTPRTAELGEPGESHKLQLELKLVADIGLVGLPNAGKSTFLSVVSAARPEIADYPFTTLVPNLGVTTQDDTTMLIADIPGLIEGASEGKGLGDEFLRHIERTAVLLHLIDVNDDVVESFRTIEAELGAYEVDMRSKPRLVVLTKAETVTPERVAEAKAVLEKASDGEVWVISAQAHQGLAPLLREAAKLVEAARVERQAAAEEAEMTVIDQLDQPTTWQVEREDDGWRVTGVGLEGFARRTNFDQADGVERLRDIFRRQGVFRELKRQGAQPGDDIRIGDNALEWLE